MPSKIDSAILRALNLDATSAKISTHGGSGITSTYRITTPTTSIFLKTSKSSGADVMLTGEHESLNTIHNAVPSLCPKSFASGRMDDGGHFLATEFVEMGWSNSRSDKARSSGLSLAQKLARLHSTPVPTPEGYDQPMYGFPITTYCGHTPQPNDFKSSWADFFAENRMLAILERSEKNNGKDAELRKLIEKIVRKVVPRLLGDGHLGGKEGIMPRIVHGDLWSGNTRSGSFVGREEQDSKQIGVVEDLIFDPATIYAHSEYEHGIMMMFGGFGHSFWKEYLEICPKTDPVQEYEDRVALYESYHHLNHYAIFGGSYKSGATSLLKPLVRKYGND